jgi:hypothetical protein
VTPLSNGNQGETVSCEALTQTGDFGILLENGEGANGGTVDLAVTLDFDHEGTGGGSGIEGWSYGICHDPDRMSVTDFSLEDTDTGAIGNGAGPSIMTVAFGDDLLPGATHGFTVYVIVDILGLTTIPAVNNWRDLQVTYELNAPELDCGNQEATLDTEVRVCSNVLGSPAVECAMERAGVRTSPAEESTGTVTITCQPIFLRGAINTPDPQVDLGDAVFILQYLFANGPPPGCMDAADVNDDALVQIADATYLLGHLFALGASPPAPYPACGPDPTEDRLSCATQTVCSGD